MEISILLLVPLTLPSSVQNHSPTYFQASYIMPRVFFITGTSTGFGYHLVEEVIARGDIAVATARKPESLSFKGTTDKVSGFR